MLLPRQRSKLALYAQHPRRISRRLHSRLQLACELLRLKDLRWGHFRGDRIAFLEIFVAIFFIQSQDVRKRPDNQPLWLSAASSGTLAPLRASRFALRRCRSAFSACFRRSVCRDIRAPVSGIVSREESYAQGTHMALARRCSAILLMCNRKLKLGGSSCLPSPIRRSNNSSPRRRRR